MGRSNTAAVITWLNGISVAAKSSDLFGDIARKEAFVSIPYSCSNGGCGTCKQSMMMLEKGDGDLNKEEDTQQQRYIQPWCISRVPKSKGYGTRIVVVPSDRYEPF